MSFGTSGGSFLIFSGGRFGGSFGRPFCLFSGGHLGDHFGENFGGRFKNFPAPRKISFLGFFLVLAHKSPRFFSSLVSSSDAGGSVRASRLGTFCKQPPGSICDGDRLFSYNAVSLQNNKHHTFWSVWVHNRAKFLSMGMRFIIWVQPFASNWCFGTSGGSFRWFYGGHFGGSFGEAFLLFSGGHFGGHFWENFVSYFLIFPAPRKNHFLENRYFWCLYT